MKKIVILIIGCFLVGCTNQKPLQFEELSDRSYINNHKDTIERVEVIKLTEGGRDCYNVDVDEAYNAINNIKIKRPSNVSVTDDDMTYIFYFEGDKVSKFQFEGEYLHIDNKNYVISDFEEVKLLEENKIECE